jgi:hypothetical protein
MIKFENSVFYLSDLIFQMVNIIRQLSTHLLRINIQTKVGTIIILLIAALIRHFQLLVSVENDLIVDLVNRPVVLKLVTLV